MRKVPLPVHLADEDTKGQKAQGWPSCTHQRGEQDADLGLSVTSFLLPTELSCSDNARCLLIGDVAGWLKNTGDEIVLKLISLIKN